MWITLEGLGWKTFSFPFSFHIYFRKQKNVVGGGGGQRRKLKCVRIGERGIWETKKRRGLPQERGLKKCWIRGEG